MMNPADATKNQSLGATLGQGNSLKTQNECAEAPEIWRELALTEKNITSLREALSDLTARLSGVLGYEFPKPCADEKDNISQSTLGQRLESAQKDLYELRLGVIEMIDRLKL